MTTPLGDLPDWQTLVAPAVTAASQEGVGPGTTVSIFQSNTPFRVWGAWISEVFGGNAAYVAGLGAAGAQIKDPAGSFLLVVNCFIATANQTDHAELAIAIPGFTPAAFLGMYTVELITDPVPANSGSTSAAGIFYSQP